MAVYYPVTAHLAPGVLRRAVSTPWGTVADQLASAKLIEEEARRAGLPPEVAAAMIVNALAESLLDPGARGDLSTDLLDIYRRSYPGNKRAISLFRSIRPPRFMSVGLFQLYERGHGKELVRYRRAGDPASGVVWDARFDPVANVQAIIREAVRRRGASSAAPPYAVEDPLSAYERGVRDVGHLTASWQHHVERPHYTRTADQHRRSQAERLFPSLVGEGAAVPPAGASVPVASRPAVAPLTIRTAPVPTPGAPAVPLPPLVELPSPPAFGPSDTDVLEGVLLVGAGVATALVLSRLGQLRPATGWA